MAELGDLLVSVGAGSRVEVTTEMMDYAFVDSCSDKNTLRAILAELKSGKEGHFPHLINHTEQKLLSVLPEAERRKIERLKANPTPADISEAETDLSNWSNEISQADQQLKAAVDGDDARIFHDPSPATHHPVRGRGGATTTIVPDVKPGQPGSKDPSSTPMASASSPEPRRISGYDFQAWEKFDVAKALDAMDEVDHTSATAREAAQERARMEAAKRRQRYLEEVADVRTSLNVDGMTELKRQKMAAREKEKGNECFKAREYEQAHWFYTRSVALDSTSAAVFANRAIAAIRLERFEAAEHDCAQALELSPNYTKAYLRRGMARYRRGRYAPALQDFKQALELEPGNKEILSLMEKAKQKFAEVEGIEYSEVVDQPIERTFTTVDGKQTRRMIAESGEPAALSGWTRSVLAKGAQAALPYGTWATAADIAGPVAQIEAIPDTTPAQQAPQPKFTKISITEEEDNNEAGVDEANVEAKQAGSRGDVETQPHSEPVQKVKEPVFTKISITEEDDEDEDEDEDEHEHGDDREANPIVEPGVGSRSADPSSSRNDERINNATSTKLEIEEVDTSSQNVDEAEWELEQLKQRATKLMAAGDHLQAISVLKQCIPLAGEALDARIVLHRQLSSCLLTLGKSDEAIEQLEEILKLDPQNVKAKFQRANLLVDQARFSEARAALKEVLHISPNDHAAMALLDALSTRELAGQINQDPVASDSFKQQGNTLLTQGDILGAIEMYSKSLAANAENLASRNNRAMAYLKRGKFVEAEADCNLVLAADPGNIKALFRRASARKEMKSYSAALADLEKIEVAEPKNTQSAKLKKEVMELMRQEGNRVLAERKPQSVVQQKAAPLVQPRTPTVPAAPVSPAVPKQPHGLDLQEVSSKKRTATPQASSTKEGRPPVGAARDDHPDSKLASSPPKEVPAARSSSMSMPMGQSSPKPKSPVRSPTKMRDLSVPSDPPATLFELERIWRTLKGRPDLLARYLRTFKTSTLKKVIKEAAEPELLSDILQATSNHLAAQHPKSALRVLQGLTKCNSFNMMAAMMFDADKAAVSSSIHELRNAGIETSALQELHAAFGV